jgi:hypothetical protein
VLAFASFELGMLAAFVRTRRGHYEALHSPQVRLRALCLPHPPTHITRDMLRQVKKRCWSSQQGAGAHRYLSESCVAEHCAAAAAAAYRADGDEVRSSHPHRFTPLHIPGYKLTLSLPPPPSLLPVPQPYASRRTAPRF